LYPRRRSPDRRDRRDRSPRRGEKQKVKRKNPIVWMEIIAKQRQTPYAETPLGKIVILLRRDVVPKTAENFLQLCTHKKGKIYYNLISKNTQFIKIIFIEHTSE
jgi:peptidyl-prolyl isomerase E (cyclophilin E)